MRKGLMHRCLWSFIRVLIIVASGHGILAQPTEEALPPNWFFNYGFIKYEANKIQQYSGNSLAFLMEKLYQLETEKDEKIHILHIGDSHIQADIFSGQVRDNFIKDTRFPVTARGFVFPYSAARTNNPYNYSTRFSGGWNGERSVKSRDFSTWGVSGISLETYDQNATIRLNPNLNGMRFFTNKVMVLHPELGGSSFQPLVLTPQGNTLIGKMQTDGATEYVFENPLQNIEIQLTKSGAQNRFILQGVRLDNRQAGVSYSAVGVNSADASSFLRCQDFEKNIALLQPDLVIVSLGTNDAYMYTFDAFQFKRNLLKIVVMIKKGYPQANILFTSPADNLRRRRHQNKNNEKAATAIKDVAEEMGLAVWDFYEVMGGFGSMEEWYSAGLSQRDRLHLSGKGYRLQGELLYQALMQAYVDYKVQKMGGR